MPLADLGVAIQISFTYFTIIYLTGLGGLFSERSGIVNIGLEGLMIIGTVTGSWGAYYFTVEMGFGQPWGPIMGLVVGLLCGHAVLAGPRGRDDHVPGRPDRLGRRDQPRRDRARAVPVDGVLRAGDAVRPRSASPQPDRHPVAVGDLPWGLGRAFSDLSPMVFLAFLVRHPGAVRSVSDAVGAAAPVGGENPEATRVTRRQRASPLRYQGVLLSGAFAGLSGAFLSIEVVNNWREGQTLGLGFIALGRAHPRRTGTLSG